MRGAPPCAQVLLGRTNDEINVLKRTYFETYNEDLSVLMSSELGGDYKKVIMAALQVRLSACSLVRCPPTGAFTRKYVRSADLV